MAKKATNTRKVRTNQRLLVLRFSAMGDVALLAPVLTAMASQYKGLSITLVTRNAFAAFFTNIPGLQVIGVNLKDHYRGVYGLYRLYRELRKLGPYDAGIDAHGSTRSRILRFFFWFEGLRFVSIVKGRREKQRQIRRDRKILTPLPHVVDRYLNVFARAGLQAAPDKAPYINPDTRSRSLAHTFLKKQGIAQRSNFWIGLAPFSTHTPKMWPLEYMQELMGLIQRELNATIFLFGGGSKEIEQLKAMQKPDDGSILVAGQLDMAGEIALVRRLHLMLAMDSFNMHLAALLGIPLLSIWGATHPWSGFGPYQYDDDSIIQIPLSELPCRPCSIFGNKGCFRGDLACMVGIRPMAVLERIKFKLDGPVIDEDLPQTD
ncbi:MAG: glycosyltransferase family 9 protein [Leptospiraceae bacterium]|nr:glycosyltransferase family 9 protein [Leptospiraceae bacterium]